MDPSLTSGGIIAVIGISTVFIALLTLIGVVTAMARTLGRQETKAKATASAEPAKVDASSDTSTSGDEPGVGVVAASEPDFHQIALSAYAYHRRVTTRVKGTEPSTSWQVAGRIREHGQRRAN